MEGLLPATELMGQLVLECLVGAMLVIAESCGCPTGPFGVPWGTLAGCVMMLLSVPWGTLVSCVQMLLTARRAWHSRRTEAQGRSCSARPEVPGNHGDTAERTMPTDDTSRPLVVEASPPTLQSLSLAAVATHLTLSLQITLGLLAKGWGSQPPTLPRPLMRNRPSGHHRRMENNLGRKCQMIGKETLLFQKEQKCSPRTLQNAGRS